ncbi:MAG: hypothetical protein P0Y49_11740 [Candidatus Pedobacter colombiensis]|uniref:Uncharacterized protein n=1 Tax=Candidatus Pedobacter colombiensis TaxID=3121371 RepID=A0AAJ5W3W2_9SPHI|nr:hypothetical protein [Pedobacter sp.]WEK17467.1 MAG: hypothetical protein P0Y49_11740 [Pedobacter sp.]
MRKLIVLGILGIIGWMPFKADAQVSINVNIGSQPLWGPVGYDYVDYYYLPDIECYYNVSRQEFIYLDNNRWIFSASLPSRYRGYDLYNGYKVVVNSRDPYRNFDRDRVAYARYRQVRGQQVIRYSNDSRYYVVNGHPHGMHQEQSRRYYSRDNDRDHGRWDRGERNHDDRGRDDRGRGDRGRNDYDGRGNDHGRGRH